MRVFLANSRAFAAECTFMLEEAYVRFLRKSLGIMAPYAPKRTALEENGSSDAVTVVDRKARYIEYRSFFNHTFFIPAIKLS